MGNFNLGVFLLAVLPVLLAITVHEAAHGYAARHYGDHTAEQLGRLTLNPLAHIDPIGTIVVPAVMFFTTGFMFGWAKPVEVNHRNFRDGRKGMFVVSLAGAGANIALGFIAWFFLMLLGELNLIGMVWQKTLWQLYRYNLMFAVFNLLPVPPLDGSKVLMGLLPGHLAYQYQKLEPYGNYILIALVLIPGLLGTLVTPFYRIIEFFIRGAASLILGIVF